MSEVRMPWEDDLAEDIESRRACMRAAAVEAYSAAAALCREEGCVCKHLYAAYGTDDSLEWNGRFRTTGTLDGLVTMGEIEIHDSRCPDALAARIEALGAPSKPRKGRKEK